MRKISARVKVLYDVDIDPGDLETRIGQLLDAALGGGQYDDNIILISVTSDNDGSDREYNFEVVRTP